MEYTVDYFIKKFEAIPDNKFISGKFVIKKYFLGFCYDTKKCAAGHCIKDTSIKKGEFPIIKNDEKELIALYKVFGVTKIENSTDFWTAQGIIAKINNGIDARYQQPTPKERILAALYDIKKIQQQIEPSFDTVIDKPFPADNKPKEVIRYVSVPASLKEKSNELLEVSN